jgi:hypothetical protein
MRLDRTLHGARAGLVLCVLCMLSACAGPARQPTSALDTVDAVDAPRSKLRGDCHRKPQLGTVCVRQARPDSDGQCACVKAERLGFWPDSSRP